MKNVCVCVSIFRPELSAGVGSDRRADVEMYGRALSVWAIRRVELSGELREGSVVAAFSSVSLCSNSNSNTNTMPWLWRFCVPFRVVHRAMYSRSRMLGSREKLITAAVAVVVESRSSSSMLGLRLLNGRYDRRMVGWLVGHNSRVRWVNPV